jgi:hypothetical protein
MNIQFNQSNNVNRVVTNTYSEDSGFEISESNESENNSVEYYEDDQEEEEEAEFIDDDAAREEAYRELLLKKRGERIDELNIFQYKNRNKFVDRIDE